MIRCIELPSRNYATQAVICILGRPTTSFIVLDQILRCVVEGFCVDIIFLDLAKAFDKLPHQRLLEKLRKHGIGGKLLRTIGNWLSKRRQRVCVKDVKST